MDTQLVRFTQWARQQPQQRYTALMGLLGRREGLKHSFEAQPGNKARGIDGESKSDYAEEVGARLAELSAKLRSLSYRPKAVRRVYIPKSNGKLRPLGIPSFEDRIVQHRLSGLLQAIWEPDSATVPTDFALSVARTKHWRGWERSSRTMGRNGWSRPTSRDSSTMSATIGS